MVKVPVPVGGVYPGGQYPAAYGAPQPFVSHPAGQPGQHPAPLVSQIPQKPKPAYPTSPADMYGGYYAPAVQPQGAGWAPSQQQGQPVQWQGYYAPAPAPARHAQRGPAAPALASSSESRRSQRLSQEQVEKPAQAASAPEAAAAPQATAPPPVVEPQEQANPGEPASEKTA